MLIIVSGKNKTGILISNAEKIKNQIKNPLSEERAFYLFF